MELFSKTQIRERAKAAGIPITTLCRRAGIPISTFYDLPDDLGTKLQRYRQLVKALERAEQEKVP